MCPADFWEEFYARVKEQAGVPSCPDATWEVMAASSVVSGGALRLRAGSEGKDAAVDALLRTPLGVDEAALERSRRFTPGSQQAFLLGKG